MLHKRQWQQFPGAYRIIKGLSQLNLKNYDSLEALLLQITAPRLRALGFTINIPTIVAHDSEGKLYKLLQMSEGDAAHASYNALLQEIDSFATAADHFLNRPKK